MQIQYFLNKVARTEAESRFYLFAFDAMQDEETTEIKIQSMAVVGTDNTITGFKILTELYNHYAHTNECPCLISLNHDLAVPTLKGEALDEAIHAFTVQYQDEMMKTMIHHKTTDELHDEEIDAYQAWDRKDFIDSPENLSEVVTYTWLSRWAAIALETHIKSWIHSIA